MRFSPTAVGLALVTTLGCQGSPNGPLPDAQRTAETIHEEDEEMQITTPAFSDHETIPTKFSCEGEDVSPALQFSGVPDDARSLALVVEDPDAPKGTFVHWVVFNIPADAPGIEEGAGDGEGLPEGAEMGQNGWRRARWGGPCPPSGEHRYFFKLYALDTELDLASPTRGDLEKAMRGHVVAESELMGTYRKRG